MERQIITTDNENNDVLYTKCNQFKLVHDDFPGFDELDLNKQWVAFDFDDNEPISLDYLLDIKHDLRDSIPSTAIGLASNQIGYTYSAFLMMVNKNQPWLIYCPEITKMRLMKNSVEGCLSIPGQQITVRRAKIVNVAGYVFNDEQQLELINMKFNGLEAFCVQHEIDHLNGLTIFDQY